MKIVNVRQRTPAWHAWRALGVTASQAAIIRGLSPHSTPWRLWAQRKGLLLPEKENFFMRRGKRGEDWVREAYERTHQTTLLPICAEWDEWPVIRASFDGVDDHGQPVELKCSCDEVHGEFRTLREKSEAYRLYFPQVQHQILVAGAARGELAVGRQDAPDDLEIMRIERDDAFIDEMLAAERAFWDALEHGKPPKPDPERDLYVPPVGAAAGRVWTVQALRYRAAAEELAALTGQAKALKKVQDQAIERLIEQMGEFAEGESAGLHVTRFLKQGPVDWKAVANAIAPDLDESMLHAHRRPSSAGVRATVKDENTAEVPIREIPFEKQPRDSFYF